jgi:hypothetical protein
LQQQEIIELKDIAMESVSNASPQLESEASNSELKQVSQAFKKR